MDRELFVGCVPPDVVLVVTRRRVLHEPGRNVQLAGVLGELFGALLVGGASPDGRQRRESGGVDRLTTGLADSICSRVKAVQGCVDLAELLAEVEFDRQVDLAFDGFRSEVTRVLPVPLHLRETDCSR